MSMPGKGGGSSGSNNQVVTQKSEPWSAQQPYLTEAFAEAQKNYKSSMPQYYPGSTIAPQSGDTLRAMDMVRTAATGNQGLIDNAIGTSNATIRGDFLSPNSNPWLKDTYNQAADAVTRQFQTVGLPGADSGMDMAGRYGSGAWKLAREAATDSYGRALTGLATDIYGGNYQAERDRMLNAANNAGATYGMGFMPSTAIAALGSQADARAQDLLNADIQRFNYNQELPNAKLSDYMKLIQGNYGGSSTTTQPLYSNSGAGLLGGLLSIGGGLLGSYFGGPMGGMAGSSAGTALGNLFGGGQGARP